MVFFYEMANGNLVEVGDRCTNLRNKQVIKKLQSELWARRQGGICGIVEYTEEHAIWYARQKKERTLG